MNSSFYIGIMGSKTQLEGITVCSNNIANINSYGFKADRPEFKSIFETEMANNYFDPTSNDLNAGAVMQTTVADISEGSYVKTDNNFDMAIAGDGWFGVQNKDRVYYTRAGTFVKDVQNYLIDMDGNYLMGTNGKNVNDKKLVTMIDKVELDPVDKQQKINLPPDLILPPKPTLKVVLKGNLDPTIKTVFDPNLQKDVEVPNIEKFSSTIISPEGEKNQIKVTFTKKVPHQLTGIIWDATLDILNEKGEVIETKKGSLSFNDKGALIESDLPSISNGGQSLTVDVGTPYSEASRSGGYDGLVSYVGMNQGKSVSKDGYSKGYLQNYEINERGEVIAVFDNGRSSPVARVSIYHFQNDEGLHKVTPTIFETTANSGEALFFKDKDGNFMENSRILSSTLETSNVTLRESLTNLLVMQKAFDASAKSITTSDQMIQKAINMKK